MSETLPDTTSSPPPRERRRRVRALVTVGLAAVIVVVAMFGFRRLSAGRVLPWRDARLPSPAKPAVSVELVPGAQDALRLLGDVAAGMGIRIAEAQVAQLADTLQLSGTLTLDAAHLQEVRSRFAGEVVEFGKTADGSRSIQFGDRVAKEDLLAVVWSRELGEKKSELIDALSQFHLDSQTLERLTKLFQDGTIPEREYREAERAVETDRNAVARVLRTLQTWRVAEDEIAAVKAEAQNLLQGGMQPSTELTDRWARVELRAALNGAVLERNVAIGDFVSPDDDLFKIADLSRLRVVAYAYEEDLPRLDALAPEQRVWTVAAPANPVAPPQRGAIEQIGEIIDPAQHTALVMGWVDNPHGRLRVGQFVTATVSLPPPGNEVVVPASALVEKGGEKMVFVKTSDPPVFTRRRVSLSRQVGSQVCLQIDPQADVKREGIQGLQPGEMVVVSGAVELEQALTELTAIAPGKGQPKADR